MKLVSAILTVFVVGCASTPPTDNVKNTVDQQKMVLDDQCATIAKYVRAIALARDTGMSQSDAKIVARGPNTFPVEQIIRDVYARPDLDPAESSVNVYDVCVKMGYGNLVNALSAAESRFTAMQSSDFAKMIADIESSPALSGEKMSLKLDYNLSSPKSKKRK